MVGALLAVRPELGSNWSSGTSVIGSVVPVAVAALAIGGALRHRPPPRPRTPRVPPASVPAAASAALAEKTTVKVPGENSKTFASTLAGNDHGAVGEREVGPLDARDQAVLTSS